MRSMTAFLILGVALLLAAFSWANGWPLALPSAAAPPGASQAEPAATLVGLDSQALDSATPKLSVQVLVKNLDTPWEIDFAPDGRIFLTERPGRIRIIKDGQLQPDPWLTLDVAQAQGDEGGLLGLALDSHFADNHYVYVAYTYRTDAGLGNRLVRLRDENGKGIADTVLLDGALGAIYHDGGRVRFGPDGKLYWTIGDARNSALAQDVAALNGKILRINSDGTIPSDNPFPNSPVYAYGVRNSEGLAWQPGTGRLYATDHGPSGVPTCCHDEINFIEPGKNYGWPVIIGNETHAGMVSPVIESGSKTTWAPSGATFVSHGPWAGSLLFAGLQGEALYRLTLDPNDPYKAQHLETWLEHQFGRLRDVVEGPDGALYILTSNRDGRGSPSPDDDRVLRLTVE
jgi:glucose/arabinose dehydrogenase